MRVGTGFLLFIFLLLTPLTLVFAIRAGVDSSPHNVEHAGIAGTLWSLFAMATAVSYKQKP